jgi:hypothetical protein
MKGDPFTLSSKGLLNLAPLSYPDSFQFIVDGCKYSCSFVVADFISGAVARLHSIDPIADCFRVDVSDPNREFGTFLSLGRGNEITVNSGNVKLFSLFAKSLQNKEFLTFLSRQMKLELNQDTVAERLQQGLVLGLDVSKEIEFCAKNFANLRKQLSEFDYSVLYSIFSAPELNLPDEDVLLDFLLELVRKDSSFAPFFELVHFEFISSNAITSFLTVARTESFFSQMNFSVWLSVCERLRLAVPASRGQVIDLPLKKGKPLEGIIAYLTKKCGGNVHDKKIVTVISHRPYNQEVGNAAKNVADLHADTEFFSSKDPNQWIGYDFKGMRVKPTAYAVRPYHSGGPGGHNLKSWVVEGSNDLQDWFELDRRVNNGDLNAGNEVKTFGIASDVRCRAVRLRQIDLNHKGTHVMLISGLELFGKLIE